VLEQAAYALDMTAPTHANVMYNTVSTPVFFAYWTLDAGADGTFYAVGDTLPARPTDDKIGIYADVTVYAVWGYDTDGNGIPDVLEDWFTITVDYEMRNGSAVAGKTSFTKQVSDGSTYTPTAAELAGTDVVLVNWELNGVLQGNTNPAISSVTAAATITLIYGQDRNNDGIEDFTITEKHESQLGGALKAASEVYVNINDTYTGSPDAALLAGIYTYEGYQWDADTTNVTNPIDPVTVIHITADHTIIFIYSPDEYMISVTREMRDGTPILGEPDLSDIVVHGANFDLTPAQTSVTGRTFVDWMLDGVLQGNTVVSLTNVISFHDIVLVYDDATANNNNSGSGFGNATIVGPQGGSPQPEQDRPQESEPGPGIRDQQPGEPEKMPGHPWLTVILLYMAAIGFYLFFLLWKKRKDDEEEEIKA
ncbi:MAG: hypothetical protein FWE78_02430, partial [Methanimicrococcus sp.]|nr:hypothetical protein [Methanimicrococcus sp.]